MKKILIILALLLLALPLDYATGCQPASRYISVPAVVSGQEGGLLQVSVRVEPGNGSVFTEIDPIVGASTQISQVKAVEQAFESTGENPQECDVYFAFLDIEQSPAVDGPSAGLAMTVALKSALENTTIRDDVAITGAILDEQQVGPIGGIIDKAQAASRNSKRILISPKHAIYENILLTKLSQEYDFVALEASTLSEAYAIATSSKSKEYESNFKLSQNEIPKNLPQRSLNSDDRKFVKVAQAINENLLGKTSFVGTGNMGQYASHFRNEAAQNERIIEMGYGYTAANNAFLSQIDAAFLSTPAHEIDLAQEIAITQQCIEGIENVIPTYQNFDWVAGANARRNWAISKVEEIINTSNEYESSEESYLALREIYYARSWCLASSEIAKQAKEIGGTQMNSTSLESYARLKINGAKKSIGNSIVKSSDAQWHAQVAEKALLKEDWAGAVFDAAYASGIQYALNMENERPSDEIEGFVDFLSKQEYSTLWARTYQSQGLYTMAVSSSKNQSVASSHGVLRLSHEMEVVFTGAKDTSTSPTISFEVSKTKPAVMDSASAAVATLVWGSIILLTAQLGTSALKK